MTSNSNSQQSPEETDETTNQVPETPPEPTPPAEQHVCLDPKELQEFRTEQCTLNAKGLCQDSTRCKMSHSETWPRRNPTLFGYECRLCPNIQFFRAENKMQLSGKCNYGRRCKYSHSKEEQLYHPDLYKTRVCLNHPNCKGYYCPFAHSREELRPRNEDLMAAAYRESYKKQNRQNRQTSRAVNGGEVVPLDETLYTAGPPLVDEFRTVLITERIDAIYRGEFNVPEREIPYNPLNSTISPAQMLNTREVLPSNQFDITTFDPITSTEGETGDSVACNRYRKDQSGNGNMDGEPNPEGPEVKQKEYALSKQETQYAMDVEEEEEEDGWFDVVIRTGLQLLSEDNPEDEMAEDTSEKSKCKKCEGKDGLCPMHNKLSQNWWI